MKKYIIISVIVILLATVAYFGYKQYTKAMNYCYNYNIKKSKVNSITSSMIDIDFAVDFKNNSDLEIKLQGYNFDILLNGVKVSQVSSTEPTSLKSNTFTTIIVPIKISITSLLSKNLINLQTAKDLISDRSKIIITIKGMVSGGLLGLSVKNMPLEIPYSLAEMMAPTTTPTTKCV